jgi:voltage-gated potassium channel
MHILLVIAGVAVAAWVTAENLPPERVAGLNIARGFILALFVAEYLIRLWIAPERRSGPGGGPHAGPNTGQWAARGGWMSSRMGVVDLIALAPGVALLAGGEFASLGPVFDKFCAAFWVLKLLHHQSEQEILARVLNNARASIFSVITTLFIVLVGAAVLMHLLEGTANPEAFGDLPKSMWWSIVTLTTVGYGDEVPVTLAGRLLAGLVMVCGIGVLAILAGILATGYAKEMDRQEFLRSWRLVASVPYFSNVTSTAIAEVAEMLHAREYRENTYVMHKGEPGDTMYFIASGEVEVRIEPNPVRLAAGEFFGEIALITRRPRTADVVTVTPVTLLVLDVADFLHLARKMPELTDAIVEAGGRRQNSGAGDSQEDRD